MAVEEDVDAERAEAILEGRAGPADDPAVLRAVLAESRKQAVLRLTEMRVQWNMARAARDGAMSKQLRAGALALAAVIADLDKSIAEVAKASGQA